MSQLPPADDFMGLIAIDTGLPLYQVQRYLCGRIVHNGDAVKIDAALAARGRTPIGRRGIRQRTPHAYCTKCGHRLTQPEARRQADDLRSGVK